jgi:hypothetical protein
MTREGEGGGEKGGEREGDKYTYIPTYTSACMRMYMNVRVRK